MSFCPISDFRRAWNGLEHFFASPAEAAASVLEPAGANYWQLRWDDCNRYFLDVVKTIPASVRSEDVFRMPQVHRDYLSKYGEQLPVLLSP